MESLHPPGHPMTGVVFGASIQETHHKTNKWSVNIKYILNVKRLSFDISHVQCIDGSVVGFIVILEHNRDEMPYKNPEETI